MGRYATDTGGGDFTPAPAGTHVARCVQLIDIGTHHGSYEGKPTVRNQVIVRWELPHETVEFDGEKQPMLVSKFYTNSLGEKANLRIDLQSWRGRQFTPEELAKFDLEAILGKPCTLTIVHTDKGKAKVTSVGGLAKGMTCPDAFNTQSAFWIDEWEQDAFETLPKGFQALIQQSDEYKKQHGAGTATSTEKRPAPADFDDDIPF